MACFGGNRKTIIKNQRDGHRIRGFKEKVRRLQEEVKAVMAEREKEVRAYEREMLLYAFKEAEWKQERKKLKEEVRRLRKVVEEQEEKGKALEAKKSDELVVVGGKSDQCGGNWEVMDAGRRGFRLENVSDESAWRDEAVDKWKKLYLAIKTELDDLIQMTHRGDTGLYLRAEEEMVEDLKIELKAKEETIEELRARLTMVELEEYRRAREVDILRQSLRIMTSKMTPTSSLPLCKPKSAPFK